MILVLLAAGIGTGLATAAATLALGQGIGLALLGYMLGGMAGMVLAGTVAAFMPLPRPVALRTRERGLSTAR